MEAAVVLCKCNYSNKTYGVRFEKRNGNWIYNWAFPIKESSGKREGYDRSFIKGQIHPTEDYPGCPYCGATGFIICGCGKMSCYKGELETFTCKWCGKTSRIGVYDGSGFSSQEDV